MKLRALIAVAVLALGSVPANARSGFSLRAVTNVEFVGWVTGSQSPNQTGDRWDVHGTDLGVMFEYGNSVMLAFGDTFGCCNVSNGTGNNWRSNVIAWSSDRNLNDGLSLDGMVTDEIGHARMVLQRQAGDVTIIPTAGITVDGRIYLHYMAVRSWDSPGRWTLNRSGWAYSDSPDSAWQLPGEATWAGDTRFGQAALVERDGYVYVFGIPGGRFGSVSLARVPRQQLLEFAAYRYWDGAEWNADLNSAAAVVPAPVGELSVAWNDYLQSWIMLYLQEAMASIVIRTAPDLTGPWSEPTAVANASRYPALYGAYLHPWAAGDTIYFNMSQWGDYNVGLMRAQLVRG